MIQYVVEPCCADKQLPQILDRGAAKAGGTSCFCTYGDVTAVRLLESIAYAVTRGELLLVCRKVSTEMLRKVNMWLDKGLITGAALLCADAGCAERVASEWRSDKLRFATYDVGSELMAIYASRDAVVLCGPMPDEPATQPALSFYMGWRRHYEMNKLVPARNPIADLLNMPKIKNLLP